MRYVMWIAEFRESSNLWTHIAPSSGRHACLSLMIIFKHSSFVMKVLRLVWSWVFPDLYGLGDLKWMRKKHLTRVVEGNTFLFPLRIKRCHNLFRSNQVLSRSLCATFQFTGEISGNLWDLEKLLSELLYSRFVIFKSVSNSIWHLSSNQARGPAELKHINKRRKRN